MIPKIIHYCWFGYGKLPILAQKCINSWKKYLPDYEIKLWNEDNFDIESNPYIQEAYNAKKYAFVTDYVRLFVLFHEGGIYMDTDVEVLKSFNELLHLPAFSGFESDTEIPTGVMASEKGGVWVREMLDYYQDRHFILPNGNYDLTTNVIIIGRIMSLNGFVLKNGYQKYKDGIVHMFPKDYFCPKGRTGIVTLTKNTYCIHHFNGSWHSPKQKMKKWFFYSVLGVNITTYLVLAKKKLKQKYQKHREC